MTAPPQRAVHGGGSRTQNRLLAVGLILISLIGIVVGQTTNATCPGTTTTSWMFNENGESPCLIWAKIQSLCLSQSSYINVPPLLDQSYSYNLPNDKSSGCQCNSVSYSLMSACALCQYPENSLPSENDWKGGCKSYSENGLGFDQYSLSIPGYALHQWSGGVFSPDTAKSSTTTPTSQQSYSATLSRSFSDFPSSTSSSSASNTPGTSPSNSSGSSNSTDDEEKSKVSWGPIIGGVAGGLVLLVLMFLLIRWRRTKNEDPNTSSKKGSKRVPYPYPSKEGDDSFLEMLNSQDRFGSTGAKKLSSSKEEKKRMELLKRRTEQLMSDPNSFKDPRTAPIPFTPNSFIRNSGFATQRSDPPKAKSKTGSKVARFITPRSPSPEVGGYTTTSQRLAERPISIHSSDLETAQNKVLIPPKQRYSQSWSDTSDEMEGMLSPQDFKQSESNFRKKSISPLPPVHHRSQNRISSSVPIENTEVDHPSMDFSIPPESRPNSSRPLSEAYTLPSLYEPRTGAKTYYARNSNYPSIYDNDNPQNKRDTGSSSIIFSPESQYPNTARYTNTPKTAKSKYPESQYTLDNYPAQETLLKKLKENGGNMKRNSTETQGTIGAALGSGKRGSWWDKRWSNVSRDSR